MSIFKLFGRKLRKPLPPQTIWTPETDVEILNKGLCPDCGSTARPNKAGNRHIECVDCGSGYVVTPCCEPPYMAASHLGFNREKRSGGK